MEKKYSCYRITPKKEEFTLKEMYEFFSAAKTLFKNCNIVFIPSFPNNFKCKEKCI